MKHVKLFEEFQYNITNEEISILSPKWKVKRIFNKKLEGKNLNDMKAATDLTTIKNVFKDVADILLIKPEHTVSIDKADVFLADSMLTCLKKMKKDIDEDKELIGNITYDPQNKKFYYISYYD